uniref:Major facilitator superfamily (MFS) profile domain-containing protein n=1 Tax=Panagrolaimus sp. JU765 TaxID=591449 RepID=A0AC34QIR5_9BILA
MADEKTRLSGSSYQEQGQRLLDSKEAARTLNSSVDNKDLEGRLTWPLLFSVIAVTIGGSFQFGYHIGNVNAPGELITQWYIQSHEYMFNTTMTKERADVVWSISVGIFAVGGMFGGLLSGWFADKFGRKGGLLFNNLFAFLAAGLMSLAKFVNVYYMVTIGRFVIGFSCGLASGLVPMYLTEVAPINLRGMLGSVHQLLVTISILVSQILGLPYLLGNEKYWPLIFAFTVVPALFQLATLPFCPESPKYNLIVKGKTDQAEKDLKKLRQKENVSVELDVIKDEAATSQEQPKSTLVSMFKRKTDQAEKDLKKLRQKENVSVELDVIKDEAATSQEQPKSTLVSMFKSPLLWPMVIAIMMMLSQQFSGINVTMFYSTKIFQDAGLKGNEPFYATIVMGFFNVAMTVVSLWLVDHPKFGRRSLHIIGLTGMMFSSILIVVSMSLAGDGENHNKFASYASIFLVVLFVVSFATGPGSIPWFFVSEIFPSSARGAANSIACMSNWLANFIVGTSFLPLNNLMGKYTFLVFAGFLAFFIFFTFKFKLTKILTKNVKIPTLVHFSNCHEPIFQYPPMLVSFFLTSGFILGVVLPRF